MKVNIYDKIREEMTGMQKQEVTEVKCGHKVETERLEMEE